MRRWAVILAIGVACGAPPEPPSAAVEPPVDVVVTGRVEPATGYIDVNAPRGAVVRSVERPVGAVVEAGDVLLRLASPALDAALEAARAALAEAEAAGVAEAAAREGRAAAARRTAEVTAARVDLALWEVSVAAEGETKERARRQLAIAEAEAVAAADALAAAESAVAEASVTPLARATAAVAAAEAASEVRAPSAGVVLEIAAVGEGVGEGPVARLGASAGRRVVVDVAPADADELFVGQRARAADTEGVVVRAAAERSSDGSRRAWVLLPMAGPLPLGSTVEVVLPRVPPSSRPVVPEVTAAATPVLSSEEVPAAATPTRAPRPAEVPSLPTLDEMRQRNKPGRFGGGLTPPPSLRPRD